MRVIEALRETGLSPGIELISPGLRVVLVVLRVEAAENAVPEVERLITQEKGVGMGRNVILVVQFVDENVVDHRVLERRVGSRPDARVHIGRR